MHRHFLLCIDNLIIDEAIHVSERKSSIAQGYTSKKSKITKEEKRTRLIPNRGSTCFWRESNGYKRQLFFLFFSPSNRIQLDQKFNLTLKTRVYVSHLTIRLFLWLLLYLAIKYHFSNASSSKINIDCSLFEVNRLNKIHWVHISIGMMIHESANWVFIR